MNSYARLLILACLFLPAVADARIWKLRDGRVWDGELQKADEFNVTVKLASKGVTRESRYKFSDEDKAYLNQVAPVFKATELNLDPPGTLPIHSKMYNSKERMLRKDFANYYGLNLPNSKEIVTAEWIQKLYPRERIVMLDQSDNDESGRMGRVKTVISQRRLYEGYIADEESKGRSLNAFTGLTLEDGTRVTAEFTAGLPPPVRWALLKIADEDEVVRIKGIRKEALAFKKSQAEEKETIAAAERHNASQVEAIAAKRKETFEKYVGRVKTYARLEREMLDREADEAQVAAAIAEQKAAPEKARLANEERKKLERDAKRAAELAAEVELERQQLKRDERLAAERDRRRQEERLAYLYNSIPSLSDLLRAGRLVKGLILVVVLIGGLLYWGFGRRLKGAA